MFSLNILLLFNFKRSLSFFLGSFGKHRWPSFYSASDTTTWRFFKDQLLYFYSNFKRQLFQMNQFRHRNTCHVLINESVKFQSEFWFILIILIRTIYFPSLLTAAFVAFGRFFFHSMSDNKLFCKELTLHLKTWHKIEIKSIHDFGRIFSCLKLLTIY